MSDRAVVGGASGEEDEVEVPLFTCRKCPGSRFTEAEKDAHRAEHKKMNETSSSVLSFAPIPQAQSSSGKKRKKVVDEEEKEAERAKKERREKAKISANKHYDATTKKQRFHTG